MTDTQIAECTDSSEPKSDNIESARVLDTLKLSEAISNLKDGIAVYRPDGRLEFCNESFRLINGYTESELNLGVVTYDELGQLDEKSSIITHKPLTFEQRMAQLRNDGSNTTLQNYKGRTYERHQSPTPAGGIISLITDITEHHRLKLIQSGRNNVLELLARGHALSEVLTAIVQNGEALFQDMLGSVLLMDETGTHLRVGAAPSLPRFYNDICDGLKIGDGVGSCGTAATLKERVIVSDISTHKYWDDFRDLVMGVGLMACWSQPIFSSGGKVLGTFAMYYNEVREPTDDELNFIYDTANLAGIAIEAHQKEKALLAAVNNAEKATLAKSEFLATMSHELRTPLNAILGFSDLLRGDYLGPLEPERYQNYATDIHNSGRHLLALIDDVLDISEIEAGKRALNKEQIDVKEMMEDCFRNFVPQATAGKISLSYEIAENLPTLYADKRSIIQIILNLVSNSLKFSPPDGTITVSISMVGNLVALKVKDTGFGIPTDVLSGISEPFSQGHTDPLITQKGTGLGLSIVKLLVETHDGELNIESAVNVGTTVTISLPIASQVETD